MSEILERSILMILSVVITTLIGEAFQLGNLSLFYAGIACVVIVNVDFNKLLQNAKDRIVGTIIGGIVGVIFSYILITPILKIIIGIILIVFFCEKMLKIPSAIATIVFLIIIFNITNEDRKSVV